MSIMEYNGAAIVAMIGKECVAIAADRRLGIQAQTVATNFQKIFEMNDRLYVGLPGLGTDVLTVDYCTGLCKTLEESLVYLQVCSREDNGALTTKFLSLDKLPNTEDCSANKLRFQLNLYQLRENREMRPKTFMHMVSNQLYTRRFGPYFVEPIVAGLDPKTNEPYIATMDLIGCPMETKDFVVGGTCTEQLYGMCESLWNPDMEPADLFETISQALLNAVDRDALSGWGAVVHIIEKDKVTTKTLKARMD